MNAIEAQYRHNLPLTNGKRFLTDGGLETTLVFQQDWDLPEFAAFVLLESSSGRQTLARYYQQYIGIAKAHEVGIILETPTWRASQGWGKKLGYSSADLHRLNQQAIAELVNLRQAQQTQRSPILISGCLGPEGDGYRPESFLSAGQAEAYHQAQIQSFASTPADMLSAMTITYAEEALGIASAAARVNMPLVISFTVETNGRLPSGMPLGDAIELVDAEAAVAPLHYMVNCAHPTHFHQELGGGNSWLQRIGGIRANASRLSHAELDECTELDKGDCLELSQQYRALQQCLPNLQVLGGCCGTDESHIAAIAACCLT